MYPNLILKLNCALPNKKMGILIKQRKIGISVGMNEYQRMCVFMVRAKEKEKKNKRKRKEKEKMEKIRVLAISPIGRL